MPPFKKIESIPSSLRMYITHTHTHQGDFEEYEEAKDDLKRRLTKDIHFKKE
jgi:hypothetical protein